MSAAISNYEKAEAKGDKGGMAAAEREAARLRSYIKTDTKNSGGSSSSGGSSGGGGSSRDDAAKRQAEVARRQIEAQIAAMLKGNESAQDLMNLIEAQTLSYDEAVKAGKMTEAELYYQRAIALCEAILDNQSNTINGVNSPSIGLSIEGDSVNSFSKLQLVSNIMKEINTSSDPNVLIGKKVIQSAYLENGSTKANLREVATALGGQVIWDGKNHEAKLLINGKKLIFDVKTMKYTISGSSNEKSFTMDSKGSIQFGIRELAEIAGVDETISYYHDNKGRLNVVVQPDMAGQAVQVVRIENEIKIKAYVHFTGSNDKFDSNTDLQMAEVAYKGIMDHWNTAEQGKAYNLYGQEVKLNLDLKVNNYSPNKVFTTEKNPDKKYIYIKLSNGSDNLTSHVLSFNGVRNVDQYIKYKEQSVLGHAWAVDAPGTVTLYSRYGDNYYNQQQYEDTAAHEFGHVLGIGDAYNAAYRDNKWAPSSYDAFDEHGIKHIVEVPKSDIMIGGSTVTDNDVRMLWEAWKNNEPQFFPRSSTDFINR